METRSSRRLLLPAGHHASSNGLHAGMQPVETLRTTPFHPLFIEQENNPIVVIGKAYRLMFPSSFHRAVESRGGKTVFEMEVSILFSSSRTCVRGSWMGMVWLMFPSSFHRAVMNGSRNLFKDKATFPSSFHRAAICYLDGIGLRIRSFPFSFHRAGL